MKIMRINSNDNTDMLVVMEKVSFVLQKGDRTRLTFDNGHTVETGVNFKEIAEAFEQVADMEGDPK